MDKKSCYLALNAVEGMTPRLFWRAMRSFPDPARIFSMPEDKIVSLGFSGKMARRLFKLDPEYVADREKEKIRELGGQLIYHDEQDYPPPLAEIPDPPPVLYLLGRLKREDRIALSVVGSRSASHQGRLNAERVSRKLAGMGMTIVSGLAMGIDTWAHKGALLAGGRTLAILGCGLDVPYPRYNLELRERIVEQGALITEFPFGAAPLPMNFPRRNRVISGISMGTLVVEAAKKSGSLITANFALDQGREVFAIPGNIESHLSSGVNALIQKGAKLVQNVEDILEELSQEVRSYLTMPPKKTKARPTTGSHEETLILKIIHKEPIHIDDLTRTTSMTPASISSLLMKLELAGQVRQLPGKLYTRP